MNTQAEKDAAKAVKKAEKDAAKAVGLPVVAPVTTDSGIEVNNPLDLRPKNLPLVVKLPAGASSAQVEYAKILNAYAYSNPKKWDKKKQDLIEKLECLAGKELAIVEEDGAARPNRTLEMNKSGYKGSPYTFTFLRDANGKPISTLPDIE